MVRYQCDLCQRVIEGKRTGFLLSIEPLIDPPLNGSIPTVEDTMRIRQMTKSALVCSHCYSNLYPVMTKEPMHSQLIITVGDKHEAIILDNNDRVITREMRVDLNPVTVQKTITEYFLKTTKGGKTNEKENKTKTKSQKESSGSKANGPNPRGVNPVQRNSKI